MPEVLTVSRVERFFCCAAVGCARVAHRQGDHERAERCWALALTHLLGWLHGRTSAVDVEGILARPTKGEDR